MVQIFIIVADIRTRDLLMESDYDLLIKKLIAAVEDGFEIRGQNDVSVTAIQSAIWTRGEATVQIEVRCVAGERKHGMDEDFFGLSKDKQERTAHLIVQEFEKFLDDQGLPPMLLSVWVKPYCNSVYVVFNGI